MQPQVAVVHIRDATVVSRQQGNFTFRNQVGLLDTGDGETLRIEISLPRDNESGYAVGKYHIAGQSFTKDNYGRPSFGNRGLYLVPVK